MSKSEFLVVLVLCFMVGNATASKADYDLRMKLFEKYDRSVVPVKNIGKYAVDVTFDLALRSISELNEKQQYLKTTVWVRIRWRDEFLTWNPQNYSGVDSINVDPKNVWTPDLVLYNSAAADSKGLIYKSMKTQITVDNEGNARWFCPMILTSECSVALADFPFDSQSCPLVFGLWTFDSLRVNLSLVRDQADLSSYLTNGVFVLKSMSAVRDELFFACCPGVPYVRLTYDVSLQRKTVFYLINILFPGLLLTIMSFFSFLLPPESGERIGLGITNLLALIFLMLMVSQTIPPISVSVPVINEFLLTVVAVNAITLISSAVAIKFLFFDGDNLKAVPWTIRILINKHIGNVVCVNRENTSCFTGKRSNFESSAPQLQRISWRTEEAAAASHRDTDPQTQTPDIEEDLEHEPSTSYDSCSKEHDVVRSGLSMVVGQIRKSDASSDYQAEWRKAIQITDRVLCILLALVTLAAGLYMFINVPKFYVR